MKTTKAIVLIAAAAAAGVAIGMLMAPEKGSDLQKKLRGSVNDLFKEFKGLIKTGEELATDAEQEAEHMLAQAGKRIG